MFFIISASKVDTLWCGVYVSGHPSLRFSSKHSTQVNASCKGEEFTGMLSISSVACCHYCILCVIYFTTRWQCTHGNAIDHVSHMLLELDVIFESGAEKG